MDSPENAVDENRRLRRTVRDLVALSTLPAVWTGLAPEGIARSLADVLLNTLSLDLIYIRLAGLTGEGPIEVVRSKHRPDAANDEAVRAAFAPLLPDRSDLPATIPDPFGAGSLNVAVTRFGVGDDYGVLVAGSRNAEFPTEQDRLLLGVGANQTAIVIQRRRAEENVRQQQEWLRVTLASIGDAVIATDTQGRVTFLNGVAQELTGWTQQQAQGRPLETVFVTLNEQSRQPVDSPVEKVLRDESVVGLGNHTILVAKGGIERPIDDSAAPIRDASGKLIGVVLIFRDVTEQRRTERALWEREQELRLVTDHAPVFLAHCDQEGRYKFVNKGYAERFGLTPQDVIGKRIPDVVGEQAYAHFRDYVEAALAGRAVEFEVEIPYERIGRHVMHCAYAPEFDGSGQVRGMVAVISDVSSRKRAEDALRESREHLRAVVETTPACIKVVAPDGTLLDMNSAGLAMVDADHPEHVKGKCVYNLVCEEYRDAFREFNERVCRGEKGSLEFEIVGLRGTRRHMETYAVPLLWPDGGLVQLAVTQDITDRKRVEDALRESEERFRATVNQVAVGVAHVGPDHRTLWANPGLCAMLGYTESEMRERTFLDLTHPDDLDADLGLGRRLLAGEIPSYRIEKRYLHKNGAVVWGDLAVSLVRDAAGGTRYIVGVVVDITDRKRLEDELRQQAKQLTDADRRKDEFLATLAHELRNPLAPIRNSLQILKMPRVDAATAQQTREMMERQVHHLVRLVDDLLDVSRVMRGKIELRKEPVELATVIARAVETAKPLIEVQGHELEISLPPDSLLLDADPVRLAQVVGNLLTNSAKYTEANGHIWLSALRESDQAVLQIRDTGIGIAPDMLPHVFELFVQADHATTKAQGGLGIGLTLVKNLVGLHGGSVEAHSAGLGKGCEFVVRLPLMSRRTQQPGDSASAEQGQAAAASGHRLLVVDDNHDAAISLSMLLRLQGHEVKVAHDGLSALEIATSFRPALVFLDLGMPTMDGYEVARRIRKTPSLENVVLAALTGWGQQDDRRRTAEAGFDHHLVKPPEPKALENLLAELK